MKEVKNFKELVEEYGEIDSCAAGTDRWLTKAFMFLIRNGFAATGPKPKRKPSAYNRFFGEQIRGGKTASEAAKAWKARK